MQAVAGASKIRIDFHPLAAKGPFSVTKEDGGKKKRYFEGVTSGIGKDGHGERMTEKCIDSFRRQAQSGDILLFAGKHDVNYIDDIARLDTFSIDEAGDWHTAYLLHELESGIGPVKQEMVDTCWAQANGLPPYTTPRGFGFSIEGDIPEGGILYMDEMGRRVIDDVKLSGVVLVRNPAYRTSVAHAVMKALGLPTAQEIRKALSGNLAEALDRKEQQRDYYDEKYQISDALEDLVCSIMGSPEPDKEDRLRDLFAQHSSLMVELILRNPDVFRDEDEEEDAGDAGPSRVYAAELTQREALHAWIVKAQGQLQTIAARLRQEGADDNEAASDGPHGDPQ